MAKGEAIKYIEKRLPHRLMNGLYNLAQKYRRRGAKLFIFGSFAQSRAYRASDLDLGVVWQKERSADTFSKLYVDVLDLPTIRKIDLVDTALIDEAFRTNIMKSAVFLADEEDVTV